MALWEKLLLPRFCEAVFHTAELMEDATILDILLAKRVLSSRRYEKLRSELRSSGPNEATRSLLLSLQVGNKFDTFLRVLPEIEGGNELHRVLTTSEAPLGSDSETDTETDSDSDQGRTILRVSVLKKYENVYKRHKCSFQSTMKRVFLKVYEKRVKVDETYLKTLLRIRSSPSHVAITKRVAFRIIFPKLSSGQVFEPHRECVTRELAEVMDISEDQVEIVVLDGSCILSIATPGNGFICFMAALDIPGRLRFLYTVDDDVIVAVDGLFEVRLKMLHDAQDTEVLGQ